MSRDLISLVDLVVVMIVEDIFSRPVVRNNNKSSYFLEVIEISLLFYPTSEGLRLTGRL